MGVAWVELDVRLSKDGVPVVFHDARLERTTNGNGRVLDHRLEELKRLDAGSWFAPEFLGQTIPTLEEALAAIAGLGLGVNIEIKPDPENEAETAQRAIEAAVRAWPVLAPLPLISSFSEPSLVMAAQISPGWPLGFLAERFNARLLARATGMKARTFNLSAHRLKLNHIHAIHDAGLAVLVYTVNKIARARRLWNMGVDGIFTDDPKNVYPV